MFRRFFWYDYPELLDISPDAFNVALSDAREGARIHLVFLDDQSFAAWCKENGLDPAAYLDADHPAGILYNRTISHQREKNGTRRVQGSLLKESALPLTARISTLKQFDGYQLISTEPSNGFYRYYSESADDYLAVMRMERIPADDDANLLLVKEEDALVSAFLPVSVAVYKQVFSLSLSSTSLVYPLSAADTLIGKFRADAGLTASLEKEFAVEAPNHAEVCAKISSFLEERGLDTTRLYDLAESNEGARRVITVINVFSYGFITLISLIAATNVFNTISTSVMLRRREFAVLKSIGLDNRAFVRMMNYECLIYGFRSLLWGLPPALALTFLIWLTSGLSYQTPFSMPWQSVVIAVGSVFVVVFLSMFYAAGKIRKDNPIDALKNETL